MVKPKPEEVSKILFAALNCLERAKEELNKEIDIVAKAYGDSLPPSKKKQYEANYGSRVIEVKGT